MESKQYRTYLKWLLVTVAVATVLLGLLTVMQFGRGTNSSYARCELVRFKRSIAEQSQEPKVLIVAGSSAIRGIVTEPLTEALSHRVVNFGLQAGLGPDIMLYEARDVTNPGDIVILALEYAHYSFQKPSNTAVDYIFGCRGEYFWHADWDQRFAILFRPDLKRMVSSFIDDPEAYWAGRGGGIDRLNEHGDIRLEERYFGPVTSELVLKRLEVPLTIEFDSQSAGARSIRKFVTWAEANQVVVMATWPNTIAFESYKTDPVFDDIRQFYEDMDVHVLGSPFDAMLDRSYFYDTQYHLGLAGILKRTERLKAILLEDPAFQEALAK